MNANKRHVVVFLGSVLGAAVLSGVALAGNPHGAAPGQTKQTGNMTTNRTVCGFHDHDASTVVALQGSITIQ